MKAILTGALGAAILCGGGLLPPAHPGPDEKLQAALEELVLGLLKDDQGLYAGMPAKAAKEELEGAANLGGEHFMPLAEASFAPKGKWQGMVNAHVDPGANEAVSALYVALFTDDYDKGKLGQFFTKLGREQGIELVQDPDDRTLYYSEGTRERNLWVALGDGLIALSVDIEDYEEDGD